ncbi:MAG: hypothetical protein D6712_03445 [Chloroflexi bacterium]|nr:MAG: hypothetical protein D6712_03445 [Chloroflexota bacterium]
MLFHGIPALNPAINDFEKDILMSFKIFCNSVSVKQRLVAEIYVNFTTSFHDNTFKTSNCQMKQI